MKQIVKESDLVGKVIERVIMGGVDGVRLFQKFTDGTFCLFCIEVDSPEDYYLVLSTKLVEPTDCTLVTLGIITEDERVKALESRRIERDRLLWQESEKIAKRKAARQARMSAICKNIFK